MTRRDDDLPPVLIVPDEPVRPARRGGPLHASTTRRFLAAWVDNLLLYVLLVPIIWIGFFNLPPSLFSGASEGTVLLVLRGLVVMIGLAGSWLYYTLTESSPLGGSLGKVLLGIRVTDMSGRGISWSQANRRFWWKQLSLLSIVGWLMQPFTAKKQALHDQQAGTLVLRRSLG